MAVSTIQDDKKKALNLAIAQIEKNCGKGSIMRLGAGSQRARVDAISTGAINLDAAIGIGGIPRGRVTEIYGPESSGKTTLCLHVVANAQREGGVAAYIDAEHALDTEYARKLGVEVENLLISQPDTGEQALEICEILVRSGAVDIVVIDSVAALVPKAEIEGDMGRIQAVKEKEDVVGSHVRVKVVKNKVAPPFKQAEFDIMYAEGISHTSLLVDIGAEANIIEKSGAWYSYNGQKIGQGRENAKLFLKDNPAMMAEVEEKVKGVLGISRATPEGEAAAEE